MAESPEDERESEVLVGLLSGAIGGVGYRGASTDPVVLARRVMESGRVRVDVPGRRTVAEVADLALRCGRAEAALARMSGERDSLAAAFRGQTAQVQEYLAQVQELEARLASGVGAGAERRS